MPQEYSKDQLWKLYESLPDDLKEAVFSEETANTIHEACTKNNLEEEKISEVAKYTGYVLLGLIPPNEFEKTLKDKVGLKDEALKQTAREIYRFVFFPLKETIEKLYEIEIESDEEDKAAAKAEKKNEPVKKPADDKKAEKKSGDPYLESIE